MTFCLGMICCFLTGAQQNNEFLFYAGILFNLVLVAFIVLLPARKKIYPFLFFLFCCPDVTQSDVDIFYAERLKSATLWQLNYGILRASWVFIAIVVFMIIILPRSKKKIEKIDIMFPLYFAIIPFLTAIIYGFLPGDGLESLITDIKYPLFLVLGIILFSRYLSCSEKHLKKIIDFSIILVLAMGCFHMLSFLLGIETTMISGVSRISVDSAKGVIVAIIFLFFVRAIERPKKIQNWLLITAFIFLLIAYQTRMLVLCFVLGLILFFVMLPLHQKIKTLISTMLILVPLMALILTSFPNVSDITEKRFRINLILSGYDLTIDDIDAVRYRASKNILWQMGRKYAYLTGLGYSSWYTDENYPFPDNLSSAFSDESIASGNFFRIHDFFLHFLLKFGLIGLGISVFMFVRPFLRLLKKYESMSSAWQQYALVAMCFMPTILMNFFWTIKTIMIAAMFLVFMRQLLKTGVRVLKPLPNRDSLDRGRVLT